MTNSPPQSEDPTASSSFIPILKQTFCFWLLVLTELGMLVLIITHCNYIIQKRSEIRALWTSLRADEVAAKAMCVQFETFLADLSQMAKTNVEAAAFAEKYGLKKN